MKVPQHSGALLLACLAVATPALAQPQGFVNLGRDCNAANTTQTTEIYNNLQQIKI